MKTGKKILIAAVLFRAAFLNGYAQSQNGIAHDPVKYEQMKSQGMDPILVPAGKNKADSLHYTLQPAKISHPGITATSGCNCTIPRDASFQVVPFQFATPPAYRNDDSYSPVINLPFSFCFYGQQFSTCYINNNGNVSFGQPYSTFSSSAFPSNQYTMVAPFWADVDTRGPVSGLVYYKVTPSALIVKWDSVGYYSMHTDKLNTFQLIITNGNDPLVPNGNNVSFCYADMQWTTGDASQGNNGFYGIPATVGANLGNGTSYVQFGRFGSPGAAYSGPFPTGPNYNGVDWLDNQSIVFNACANNIPPVPSGIVACDTVTTCEGDTLDFNVNFASPEVTQTTVATYTAPGLQGVTVINNTSGNSANIHLKIVASGLNAGYNTLTFSATDNGTPPMTTNISIVIYIDTFSAPKPVISGNARYCTGGTGVTLTCSNNGYTSFLWNTGATTQSITNATAGVYHCTVRYNGCYKTDSFVVSTWPLPTPVISGAMVVCGNTPAHLSAANPAYATYSWSNGATTSFIDVMNGSYTVTVTDTNGCTGTSAAVNVSVSPVPAASFTFTPSPTSNIGNMSVFTDHSTVTSGNIVSWSWNFGDGGTSSLQNPTHYYTNEGTFSILLVVTTQAGCIDSIRWTVRVEAGYTFYVPDAFTPNGDGLNDVFLPKFSAIEPSSFEMYIFDRWGNLIFKNNDTAQGWLGKVNNAGEIVQEDIYEYLFKFKDLGGHGHSVIGHVSVIR